MVSFKFNTFKGIRPRTRARFLPLGEAQTAENIRLGSGGMEPWSDNVTVQAESTAGVASIYRMRNNGSAIWLESVNDVDYAPGPLPDDPLERTYYTGETQPRMTYIGIVQGGPPTPPLPDDYRYLGIPAPDTAPTLVGDPLLSSVTTGQTDADSFESPYLHADVTIQDAVPNNPAELTTGWAFGDDSGFATAGIVRTFEFNFYVGKEILVTSVVDSDHVTLADAGGAQYLAEPVLDSRVDSSSQDLAYNKIRNGGGSSGDGFIRFYLPNDTPFEITGHNLEEGDIIRVTSVESSMRLSLTNSAPMFYGHETTAGGDVDVATWPDSVIMPADSFYLTGGSYPFIKVYKDLDGEASTGTFSLLGQFSFELVSRNGISYEDLLSMIESRTYVFTYVSFLGEEGPPSPPSEVVTIPTDGDVVVTQTGTPPSTFRDIDFWRIYRANTGNEVTDFQFVEEVAIGTTTFDDDYMDIDLGEPLQTTTWDVPPTALEGIVAGPNGMMAGFVGKDVYLCEPKFPHAWPPEYKQSFAHDVVGIGVLPNGFAVLTKGTPYALIGDHPRSMSQTHYQFSQACVSKRSIINTIDSVIYASPDGLCSMGANGFSVLTEPYATKREWQAFNPETMIGAWHDGKYFGFYDDGGIVFDPNNPDVGLTTLSLDTVEAVFVDSETDLLYILNGTNIQTFDATPDDFEGNDAQATMSWKSGKLVAPFPCNLGAGRIVASNYPVTISIWNDQGDAVVTNRSITDGNAFRLPGGYLSDWFEVQIDSVYSIEALFLAETIEEILDG